MALYAFDGTWNTDVEDDSFDTNVTRFVELYGLPDKVHYLEGVGTRLGAVGKVLGGLFGLGGRSRVEEMTEHLRKNWENGDEVIDVVGFSRGAALALHFTHQLGDHGLTLSNGDIAKPRVRFLGLWDTVASFGLSFDTVINFNEINLGWDVNTLSSSVDHCFHAMALDERRETFQITRLNENQSSENIEELWFRGVHSDVGGGNGNYERSNIALHWMVGRADSVGVPVNFEIRKEEKYNQQNKFAEISENKDVKIDKRRKVFEKDKFHPTAEPLYLTKGVKYKTNVYAKRRYNWSGVTLEKGKQYRVSVADNQIWEDGGIDCSADGWESGQLRKFKEAFVKNLEGRRRCPEANWFELVGSYGDEDDHVFRIGSSVTITAERNADLYLFANDLKTFYYNNKGLLEVVVEIV